MNALAESGAEILIEPKTVGAAVRQSQRETSVSTTVNEASVRKEGILAKPTATSSPAVTTKTDDADDVPDFLSRMRRKR